MAIMKYSIGLWILMLFLGGCHLTRGADVADVSREQNESINDGPDGRWVRTFTGENQVSFSVLAATDDGSVTAAGLFGPCPDLCFGGRDLDLDPGPSVTWRNSAGYDDMFIARLGRTGELDWAHIIGSADSEAPEAIVAAPDGSVVIAGLFRGSVDFDPSPGVDERTSAGGDDVFILRFDRHGNRRWVRTIGGPGNDWTRDMAMAHDGSVVLVGKVRREADLDPGPGVVNAPDVRRGTAFALCLDEQGEYRWSRTMEGPSGSIANGVAVSEEGVVFITGVFSGLVDFDPGHEADERRSSGTASAFITCLGPEGDYRWTKVFHSSRWIYTHAVALLPDGAIVVTGWFDGEALFTSEEEGHPSQGGEDVFIVLLSTEGVVSWAKTFGGEAHDHGFDIAVTDQGTILATGDIRGSVDFDPGAETDTRQQADGTGAFLVRYTRDGDYRGTWLIGRLGRSQGIRLDVASEGTVFVAGSFSNRIDFSPGPLVDERTSNRLLSDAFVARMTSSLSELSRGEQVNP